MRGGISHERFSQLASPTQERKMTTFPGSPRLLKGGIVLIDPNTSAVQRIIALQYNPDTLTRTLQVKGVGAEGGDRSESLILIFINV